MTPAAIAEAARPLIEGAGFPARFALVPLAGGANNRVFRVEAADRAALLKTYYRHPGDHRDRLGAEVAFVRFAWRYGIASVPRPLGEDAAGGLALYEFVAGKPLAPGEVGEGEVGEALAFYAALNRHRGSPDGRRLPPAQEACFRLADHLGAVSRRVLGLAALSADEPADRDARRLIRERLVPAWREVAIRARQRARAGGLDLDAEIAPEDRRLSPSDFGFHNAIRRDDGRLCFIDFEYAGWDDPAKLVGDFFNQPEVPAPARSYPVVAEAVAADLGEPAAARSRFALLAPVYAVKWICIMLNDFLPAGRDRRRFAAGAGGERQRQRAQLAKAATALDRLEQSMAEAG